MSRAALHAKSSQPPIDTQAAAVAVGVRPGTVRSWASRKLIRSVGVDARRRKLYNIEDIYAVTRATDPECIS